MDEKYLIEELVARYDGIRMNFSTIVSEIVGTLKREKGWKSPAELAEHDRVVAEKAVEESKGGLEADLLAIGFWKKPKPVGVMIHVGCACGHIVEPLAKQNEPRQCSTCGHWVEPHISTCTAHDGLVTRASEPACAKFEGKPYPAVHKAIGSNQFGGLVFECGGHTKLFLSPTHTLDWSLVTCEDCLKHKPEPSKPEPPAPEEIEVWVGKDKATAFGSKSVMERVFFTSGYGDSTTFDEWLATYYTKRKAVLV